MTSTPIMVNMSLSLFYFPAVYILLSIFSTVLSQGLRTVARSDQPCAILCLLIRCTFQSGPSSWLEMHNFIGDLVASNASGSAGQLLKYHNQQSLRSAWETVGPEAPTPKPSHPGQSDPTRQSQGKTVVGFGLQSGERSEEPVDFSDQQCELMPGQKIGRPRFKHICLWWRLLTFIYLLLHSSATYLHLSWLSAFIHVHCTFSAEPETQKHFLPPESISSSPCVRLTVAVQRVHFHAGQPWFVSRPGSLYRGGE